MSNPLRVLLAEDSEDDAWLLVYELRRGGYEPAWERVDTAVALRTALARQDWDVITCDWVMPRLSAPEAMRVIQEHGRDTPTIIVSGEVGEEIAVSAMKVGAVDFVSKHRLARLVPAIERELRDAAARRRAEQALADSERHFRSVIENASDLITIVDEEGRVHYASPSHERALGYPPEALVGTYAFDLVHPDDLSRVIEEFRQTIATPQVVRRAEYRVRHRDGSWRIFEGVARNALDDPQVRGVILTSRDIGERRHAEEQRDRLIAAVEQTAESIMITDAQGGLVYANPASERLSGYSRAHLSSQGPRSLFTGWNATDAFRGLLATVGRGEVWRGCVQPLREDGSLAEVEAIVSPVYDAGGRLISYVGVGHDVTQSRQMEAQLRRTQKLEAIAQLAGGVAHYFNNQLMVITGAAQFLLAELPAADAGRRDAALINAAADRCARLVRQLVLFSRQGPQESCSLNLGDVVNDLAPMLRLLLGEQTTLRVHVAAELWWVHADRSHIELVVTNLVANARDAIAPEGTPTLGDCVTIETANVEVDAIGRLAPGGNLAAGRHVMLAVTDNGPGVASETRERIFEPFFTTKGVGKGTGLGLAAVLGIVEQHHGCVVCASEPGRGATFRVFLPAAADTAVAAAPATTGEPAAPQSATVLVVEDDDAVRDLLVRLLERAGYRVFSAAAAAPALALAARVDGVIDLLVSDIVMPGDGGHVLAHRLLERYPSLRVLYVSGYAAAQLTVPAPPGAQFLSKPFNLDDLRRVVRALIGRAEVDQRKDG